MDFQKCKSSSEAPSLSMVPLSFSNKLHERPQCQERNTDHVVADVDIDLREVYFLIMHFLSAGPCQKTFGQFWNELLEHELLPRRYHAWYSRSGACSGDENDNGFSFPLGYNNLVERYPHIGKDHLVKLLKQLMLNTAPPLHGEVGGNAPSAVDVPTLLGTGSFSLLDCHKKKENKQVKPPPDYLRWPHMQADQVRGLSLREIGGGFTKHHRAPSIRSACYAIAKPSTMVQRMQNMKKLRGHRDAVYCAIFDRSGRYVITGSDDRLVKIWSMETAFCLASCRGHEGDITDLAVSSNNVLVASASNDFIIRVWRLPDGLPISVLRGHTGAVTAIAFSPRPSSVYQLLSSSDDGSCRIWDARFSQCSPRIYLPKPPDAVAGKNSVPSMNGTSSSNGPQSHQILCCAFNASGTVFVTGSSDTFARVWSACKSSTDDSEQPNHEIDVLSGHENDVNYVQFSACAGASRSSVSDTFKEESLPKFKNSWFCHDNIVTCSRDGSAIIWIPRSRRYHGKVGRWTRAYHLKVPPPPMPPQPPRGGPRQRLLPTPRGVNMIVWSLDNRFVLAAIMDCRICVWNAADGSLVHSLTGHSASTYVLDVHPFNPRIAMSAGYDGKTIVWDIWEGIPIRTYEIGRFKLVDGKFSPDGTSIVLSDDVGQIYLLNTGQGESQKDAKYDQFFLGDYRPLIRDTIGNVLDQETQLAPHRRNIQDPLCDSSMIPYSEPYQTMYQQRRLGALGIEWHPSSINLAVGPDFSLGQEYQMPPLADLDRVMEPLPELVDAVYWEPENEVISDDTDSEYNIAEEYSSEGEHGSLSAASSFSDPECSAEDTDVEHSHKDGLRRSRRKKYRSEVEIMTSSGRRVKRRNLNECDGTSSRSRTKKSKNGRKVSKRNSSKIQSLRPQRAAKRNALNMFSQITETSTEGDDEEGLEDDSSGSDPMMHDSNMQNTKSDRNLQNVQQKYQRGEQSSLDEFENAIKFPESQSNAGNRRRLVLKFSLRDSKKSIPSEDTRPKCNTQADIVHSPSRPPPKTVEEKETNLISEDPESSSMHAADLEQSQNHNRDDFIHKPRSEETEDHLDTSAGYKDNKIRWGEVKARSSKRFRSGDFVASDVCTGFDVSFDVHNGNGKDINGQTKPENGCGNSSPSEIQNHAGELLEKLGRDVEPFGTGLENMDDVKNNELAPPDELAPPGEANKSSSFQGLSLLDDHQKIDASAIASNGNLNKQHKGWSGSDECRDCDSLEMDETVGINHSHDLKGNPPANSLKLRIRSKRIVRDPNFPSKLKFVTGTEEPSNIGGDLMSRSHSRMEHNQISEVPEEDKVIETPSSPHRSHSNSDKQNYDAVHKRAKSYMARTNAEGYGGSMEESASNAGNYNYDSGIDFHEATTDAIHRTRSMVRDTTSQEPNNVMSRFKVREETSKNAENHSKKTRDQLQSEEWMSSSRMRVRSRSTRYRRGDYDNYLSPSAGRISNFSGRKVSWLMLSEHEEGYRYIPQQGDEVVYLRQGHQEYIEKLNLRSEVGPWRSPKTNIRAVEICSVEDLVYASLAGSGDSCCKITLKFTDPLSSVFGRTFKLTLPELINFSDFVVEKTRYDAAIGRNWTHRDKCLVWWRNGEDGGGSWWEGRILAVEAKSREFPDSPWERYVVKYKGDAENNLHSPWELHDPDIQWEQPQIDFEIRDKLLSSFAKLESAHKIQDYYGIQKFNQVAQKLDFLNRFPVPLYPELIQARLENNYYRTLEAVKHDIMVMLSNAQSYFGRNAELSSKMKRLSDWFTRTLSKL